MRSILDEEINKLKQKGDGSLQFVEGSHIFVKQYMIRLVDTLLFGYGAEVPKSKSGLSFSEEIVKICEIIYSKRVGFNAWNALTRDFLNKYKLLPGSREICERSEYLKEKVIELIQKRTLQYQQSNTAVASTNVIDLMINHNLTCEPNKRLTLD